MKLTTFAYTTTFALLASTAMSQTTRDDVIRTLSDAGYTRIEVSRTFFGNTKFEAYGPNGEREIVLGKGGAILRDDSEADDGNDSVSGVYDDEGDDRDDDENDSVSSGYDDEDDSSSDDESSSSSSSEDAKE